MKIPYGFLSEFTELLLDRYQNRINKDYAFALSEVLLSSCCWGIRYTNKYGSGQPNIWIQVILPSGDIKSTPINKLIRPIMLAVEHNLNEGRSKKLKIIISQYTPESIIRFMNEHIEEKYDPETKETEKETHIGNVGLIVSDESSMQSRGIKSKDYMSGLLEIDSMIYDGTIPERYTNTHGLSSVPYCYKAKISATTPVIYGIMEESDVIQGGWNRYDVVVGVPMENITMHDPESYFQHRTQEQINEEYEIYATKLVNVIQSKVNMVYFTDDAAEMWCKYEFQQQIDKKTIGEKDLRRGYKNRMAEKVLKRAVLYAISRHIDVMKESKTGDILVDAEEMEAAIANQEEYYKHWQTMLSIWKLSPKAGESILTTDAAKRDRLKAVLQMRDYISRRRVIEETGWNDGSRHLKETVDSFSEEKRIQIISLGNSRALIEAHKDDKEWLEWQRVKYPPRGVLPIFYHWVE